MRWTRPPALVAEVPGTADRFSFTHALIRTRLYEELSAPHRARLHRRVAEALEERITVRRYPYARCGDCWQILPRLAELARDRLSIGIFRRALPRRLCAVSLPRLLSRGPGRVFV